MLIQTLNKLRVSKKVSKKFHFFKNRIYICKMKSRTVRYFKQIKEVKKTMRFVRYKKIFSQYLYEDNKRFAENFKSSMKEAYHKWVANGCSESDEIFGTKIHVDTNPIENRVSITWVQVPQI